MMEGTVFKNKALVTAVNPYDFDNDQKERVSGVTMEFLMTDNLHPCGEGEAKGIKIIKDSVMYDKKDRFTFVPGMYELSFKMMPANKSGKPQLKVVDAMFIGDVELVVNEAAAMQQSA
jgi:hypothetical protein